MLGDLLSSAIITTYQHNPGTHCLEKCCRGIDDSSMVRPNQQICLEINITGQKQALGGGGDVASKQNSLSSISDPGNQRGIVG